MEEEVIRHLLSKVVSKYLDQIDHDWKADQKKEICERIAEVAWNGLILLAATVQPIQAAICRSLMQLRLTTQFLSRCLAVAP